MDYAGQISVSSAIYEIGSVYYIPLPTNPNAIFLILISLQAICFEELHEAISVHRFDYIEILCNINILRRYRFHIMALC